VVDEGLPYGLGSVPMEEAHSAESRLPLPEPTADDGVRLSGPLPWAEEARPTRPRPPDRRYSAQQRSAPEMLLRSMVTCGRSWNPFGRWPSRVRQGSIDVGVARSALNEMAIRQNNWTLGA